MDLLTSPKYGVEDTLHQFMLEQGKAISANLRQLYNLVICYDYFSHIKDK